MDEMAIVYIGLGGNLPSIAGAPEATLASAAERLASLGRVARRSRLYSTAPVGFASQPHFVNAVVALETGLDLRALLDVLLGIEREFGRDRSISIPNGPRTLDLDILLYGTEVIHAAALQVPHPRLAGRAFVLAPLSEIAPDAPVPGTGQTVRQLLEGLGASADDAVRPVESAIWSAT
jgi:2-amino-4-hydroxy-6-hydroxymethyldihydropteridine diphosphokinase